MAYNLEPTCALSMSGSYKYVDNRISRVFWLDEVFIDKFIFIVYVS